MSNIITLLFSYISGQLIFMRLNKSKETRSQVYVETGMILTKQTPMDTIYYKYLMKWARNLLKKKRNFLRHLCSVNGFTATMGSRTLKPPVFEALLYRSSGLICGPVMSEHPMVKSISTSHWPTKLATQSWN